MSEYSNLILLIWIDRNSTELHCGLGLNLTAQSYTVKVNTDKFDVLSEHSSLYRLQCWTVTDPTVSSRPEGRSCSSAIRHSGRWGRKCGDFLQCGEWGQPTPAVSPPATSLTSLSGGSREEFQVYKGRRGVRNMELYSHPQSRSVCTPSPNNCKIS